MTKSSRRVTHIALACASGQSQVTRRKQRAPTGERRSRGSRGRVTLRAPGEGSRRDAARASTGPLGTNSAGLRGWERTRKRVRSHGPARRGRFRCRMGGRCRGPGRCRSRRNWERLARPSRIALEEAATRLAYLRAAVSRGTRPYRARGCVSSALRPSSVRGL